METVPEELTFALGEGQKAIIVFEDTDSENLGFPTVFCRQWRADNKDQYIPVHYSDICKYELQSVDRRAATNIPNIFFKLKKLQMKQVLSKATLAIWQFKTKGKS